MRGPPSIWRIAWMAAQASCMNPCSTPKPGRNPGTYDVVPHEDLQVSYVRPCVAGRVFAVALHPSSPSIPFSRHSFCYTPSSVYQQQRHHLGSLNHHSKLQRSPPSPTSPLLTSPCPTQTPTKTPATAAALNHAADAARTNERNNPPTPKPNQWPQYASNPLPKNSATQKPPAQRKCNPSNASPHPPNP